jgi:high-affinity iron transporter
VPDVLEPIVLVPSPRRVRGLDVSNASPMIVEPAAENAPGATEPDETPSARRGRRAPVRASLAFAAALVVAVVLVWQAVTSGGNPSPTSKDISPAAAILNTGILVFREGLEAVLVLATLTASFVRTGERYWRPIALGAGLSLLASLATWFVVVAIVDRIDAPALEVQAVTGLLAIGVLLVIMNWFFHKLYWTGWIGLHERRKRAIVDESHAGGTVFWGLFLLGLTAIYREGFEVVLFLQDLRLRAGSHVVLLGTVIGLSLSGIVAILTFVAQRRLPYRKMLVATGVLLGGVLLVMVGESAQEFQQAGWLSTTPVHVAVPEWLGTWFAIFPNVEGLASQLGAAIVILGSYAVAKRRRTNRSVETTSAGVA